MTNAPRDKNSVPVKLGASNADGKTPLPLQVDPTQHGILIDDNTTGTDKSSANARRDDNSVPIMMGVSSADGVTPVMAYIDSTSNKLLVNSN